MSTPELTKQVFAVLVHVRTVPEELAIRVALVKHLETLLVWLWVAIERTLFRIRFSSLLQLTY